jgi:hypothetical protein
MKTAIQFRDRRDLPNKEGFMFVAYFEDDTNTIQRVHKDKNGLHWTPNYNKITKWRKL